MATENFPIVALVLPDGRRLKAVAVDDENFPAINIEIVSGILILTGFVRY